MWPKRGTESQNSTAGSLGAMLLSKATTWANAHHWTYRFLLEGVDVAIIFKIEETEIFYYTEQFYPAEQTKNIISQVE